MIPLVHVLIITLHTPTKGDTLPVTTANTVCPHKRLSDTQPVTTANTVCPHERLFDTLPVTTANIYTLTKSLIKIQLVTSHNKV